MTRTTRLMFRPVVLSDSRPNTSPITTTGITNQFSHPSSGMNATSAATRATIPISAEIRFYRLLEVPADACLGQTIGPPAVPSPRHSRACQTADVATDLCGLARVAQYAGAAIPPGEPSRL